MTEKKKPTNTNLQRAAGLKLQMIATASSSLFCFPSCLGQLVGLSGLPAGISEVILEVAELWSTCPAQVIALPIYSQ